MHGHFPSCLHAKEEVAVAHSQGTQREPKMLLGLSMEGQEGSVGFRVGVLFSCDPTLGGFPCTKLIPQPLFLFSQPHSRNIQPFQYRGRKVSLKIKLCNVPPLHKVQETYMCPR